MVSSLIHLRQHAVATSLFPPTSLAQAIQNLGFVQADPIRAPARAQDLILRHRVHDYRIDDLDQQYPKLNLEEDFLYAYGFMPPSTWQLLHPRLQSTLSPLQQKVLAILTHHRLIHPRQLEAYLGTHPERNDWGGYSNATTHALQTLHRQGYIRVAHRESGIRLYELAAPPPSLLEPDERLRQLVLLLAKLLGPLSERSLRAFVHRLRDATHTSISRRSIVSKIVEAADLASVVIDHIRYVWPVSEKPPSGYDKKTMAADIVALVQQLGLTKVHIMGHDIGGMVAMSFAFNYPQFTQKLIVLDGAHPTEGIMQMSLLPAPGTFTQKMDADRPYAWWMGFNQVKELPEKLLAGRFEYVLDWLFHYVMIDDSKMSSLERAVYASWYNEAESIRASNGWYQTFHQDIDDAKTYPPLAMPVLGIGSYVSYNYMKMGLPYVAKDLQLVGVLDSGHYLFEEQPAQVLEAVLNFLG